jgi:hypothetical protein
VNLAGIDRRLQCAVGFALMRAVTKFALARKRA